MAKVCEQEFVNMTEIILAITRGKFIKRKSVETECYGLFDGNLVCYNLITNNIRFIHFEIIEIVPYEDWVLCTERETPDKLFGMMIRRHNKNKVLMFISIIIITFSIILINDVIKG